MKKIAAAGVAGMIAGMLGFGGPARGEIPRTVSGLADQATAQVSPELLENLDVLMNLEMLETLDVHEDFEVTHDTVPKRP